MGSTIVPRSTRRLKRVLLLSAALLACLLMLLSISLPPGTVIAMREPAPLPADEPWTPTPLPGTGSLVGRGWVDSDGDGVLDPGELPLAGVTVMTTNSDTGAASSATSGVDGTYRIVGLAPALYRVVAAPPTGYELTTSSVYDVLAASGATLVLDFGARVPPTLTPSPTPPPVLDVDGAETLTCGGIYAGDTQTGKNNVSSYACRSWWDESGKEKVYRLELSARQPVTVTLLNASTDLDLFLLRYALPESCVAAGDNYVTYAAESGPYFLSIDGYRGTSGSYVFRVDCPTDTQATATPTFTPSATPTPTPTGKPAPTLTATPMQEPRLLFLPMVLAPSSEPPLPVTFVLQDGLNGYVGTTDTTLNSWDPANPYGSSKVLSIFYARPPQISSQMETALRFDLSLLPRNATVEKALLRLYVPATPLYDIRAQVAGLLRPWEEQTATWEEASPNQPWAIPGAGGVGADRTEWVSAAERIVEGSQWYEFDLTKLVREWAANPERNFGMLVSARAGDSNANVEARFVSREGTASWRPQLIVSYSLPPGASGQP